MSSSQSSSDQSETVQPKKVKKVPVVMEPFGKVKTKTKEIVINLSMTKYDVLTKVAEELQWKIQSSKRKNDWDVMWVDSMIQPEILLKMHFYQKVSHFPGIHVLARKNLLGLSFMEMKKKFQLDYDFFPKTWLLPGDYPEFRQQVEKGEHHCYIVKPQAECQGKGIFLTFKTDEIENGKHYVIQQYVSRPFLIDKLKFDFRVYVLLCGTSPMRLYIYEEGLARFSTQPYEIPKKSNLKNKCMHLTNYAINKKNPKFIFNKSAKNMSEGHKRSLTSVFQSIEKMGLNVNVMKEKIYDVIVKTVILGQPLVSHQYKFAQPDDEYRNMCFHILGIDVMINQFLNPVVIEVNHTPSFATDTPLDYSIKHDLIKDTLILMNITTEKKKELVKKTNNYQRERIINGKRLVETEEQKEKITKAQKQRDQFEDEHLGKYKKIYPVEDEEKMSKYEQYMKAAQKSYFSQSNFIRQQIEAEKEKESPVKRQKSVANQKRRVYYKNQNHSEKKIEKRAKNYSTQIYRQECTTSFQTTNPYLTLKSKKVFSSPKTRIMKSISEFDKRKMETSDVKKLPKLAELQASQPQIIQLQKSHYMSLRKRKIHDKEDRKNQKVLEVKETGTYLTPKVVIFDKYNEDDFLDFERFEHINLKMHQGKGATCYISKKYE